MRFVLDASVAVKWFLDDEEFTPEAAFVFEAFRAGKLTLTAPVTLHAEVAHGMRGAFLHRRVTRADLLAACDALMHAPIRVHSVAGLARPAMELALKHNGSFYDALYVALAVKEDTRVLVADAAMSRAFGRTARCLHISHFRI